MSLALKPHPFQPYKKSSVVHSLQKYCVFTLIEYRQCLEDIGWIDTESLKEVLRHCDANELATIEDATREGSDRDISWYTWDLWYILYVKEHARPPSTLQVPSLSGEPPPDYFAPRCEGKEGDWRLAFQMKAAEKAERLRMISVKLGAKSKEEELAKKQRTAKQIVLAPPPGPRRRKAGPTVGVTRSKGPSNALFSKSKSSQPVVSMGSGWGKPPIQSLVKKPTPTGLGSKGVKIVATAASMAKKLGTASGSSQRTSASPSSSASPKPHRPPLSLHESASAAKPSPMSSSRPTLPPSVRPPSGSGPIVDPKSSAMFITRPQKRSTSALAGVDLAELIASASAKKSRQ